MICGWKYCSSPMAGCGQTVNTNGFLKFQLSGVFATWLPSGVLCDTIFRGLGVPWEVFGWF